MKHEAPRDIYVITTAKKRDSLDWVGEAAQFSITDSLAIHEDNAGKMETGILTVDSWNNLHNYVDVEDAFFIFDEQRVIGYGPWAKNFIKIARKNRWVLLSATPGDGWMDYAPVFIANGYYKNITEFKFKHVLYEPYVRFPRIRGWLNETKLELLRNEVLVEMPYEKHTTRFLNYLDVGLDQELWKKVTKDRWNPYEDRPIKDVAELYRLMRRVAYSDPSRLETVKFLMMFHPKLLIFYNFNYELEILRTLHDSVEVYEYNGRKKDPLPTSDRWVYLIQYVAGAEGWNCTSTDAMVLYSLTYSYKNFEQAQGRNDRMNTEFSSLYYYILVSNSKIDIAVRKSLGEKKNFNEKKFTKTDPEISEIQQDFDFYRKTCQI
jgi:hypothetical protein